MNPIDRTFAFIAHRYIYVALLCFSISLAAHLIQYLAGLGDTSVSYVSTSFAVNYFEYGFVKRGLIGTLLIWFPSKNYVFTALFFSILIFLLLLIVFSKLVEKIGDTRTKDFLKTTFAVSPFTSFQFGFEIGRLDLYNILLLIAVLYFINQRKWLLVLFLSACGLLLHEAFATFAVPIIFAYTLMQPPGNFPLKKPAKYAYLVSYLITCGLLAYVITEYGNSALVVENAPGRGQDAWDRSLVQHGLSSLGYLTLTILIITTTGIYSFLISFYKTNKAKNDPLFFAAFAPLGLFILGVDYARWTGLIAIAVLVIFFIKATTEQWKLSSDTPRYTLALFVLPFGPIGDEEAFPFLRIALGNLEKIAHLVF